MDDAAGDLAELAARVREQTGRLAGSSPDGPLARVRAARQLGVLADQALRATVARARAAGHTWQEIGTLLGVSRQAAFQRFGSPLDPRTGEPMSNAELPDAANLATAVLLDWIEGRHGDVVARFDATMAERLPADHLAAAYAQVVGMVGGYQQRMGEPLVRQLGDHTVVDIPLDFEAGEMKGRVSFDREARVDGLYLLTPDTP